MMKPGWWPFQKKYGWKTSRDLPLLLFMLLAPAVFVGFVFFMLWVEGVCRL